MTILLEVVIEERDENRRRHRYDPDVGQWDRRLLAFFLAFSDLNTVSLNGH
jgi:hypothetical protein